MSQKAFISWVIVSILSLSVLSKYAWEYFKWPDLYFWGEAIIWSMAAALLVNAYKETIWPRKWALVLFWWAICDIIEMYFMYRTAFDINEWITAGVSLLILICTPNGRRKRRNGPIRGRGWK